jgi:hypothetical protein
MLEHARGGTDIMGRILPVGLILGMALANAAWAVDDKSPLIEKAAHFQQVLLERHWLDGLYVGIIDSPPPGAKVPLPHTVNQPGNVIHAGVWTGRYLGGVGYQYAVTKHPRVREIGGQILKALRILQEVTGKPGLLCRGYVKGHGPVVGWERDGADSKEWRQGQGQYADYRFYSDVSVDNFNAVLYGYAIYFDLAADEEQKRYIAYDVDRLMTHVLDNHCRIIDLDGEPTQYGHIGVDPDSARDEYYARRRSGFGGAAGRTSLRSELFLLADLLIAHHITGKVRYSDFYKKVIDRFKGNPDAGTNRPASTKASAPQRRRMDHSSQGQAYESLYNLIRYESDPELLARYRSWVSTMWETNWFEGNALFNYMALALLPEYRDAAQIAAKRAPTTPHSAEALQGARETLELYPVDRVMHPVMNSIRKDLEIIAAPGRGGATQARSRNPLPINVRPYDNEYAWKGNVYQLDGWLKPIVTAMQFARDDPKVAWFSDTTGAAYSTLDAGKSWQSVTNGMMGAGVQNLAPSPSRTFVVYAQTSAGVFLSRDGGLSWRLAPAGDRPAFTAYDFKRPLTLASGATLRINALDELVRSTDGGSTSQLAMNGWRIPRAKSLFQTPWGIIASGPGGAYRSADGQAWEELKLWREMETGPADFLHAYWMGRYYGFLQ